jgi:hypothetical protein
MDYCVEMEPGSAIRRESRSCLLGYESWVKYMIN